MISVCPGGLRYVSRQLSLKELEIWYTVSSGSETSGPFYQPPKYSPPYFHIINL